MQHATDPGALDAEAISQRIRQMLIDLRKSGTDFCSETGIAYSTFRAYMSGRPPGPEFLAAAFRVYGYMPSWLLTGCGQRRIDSVPGDSDSHDYVAVPVYSAQAAAGVGAINGDAAEHAVGEHCVSRTWLRKRGLSPQHLRVIEIRGNSMDGVLYHGDRVLTDMSDTQPRSGFVYVLRQGEELLAKFCQLLPDGILRVSSANPTYPSYDVNLTKSPDVAIVGRIVTSMHDW